MDSKEIYIYIEIALRFALGKYVDLRLGMVEFFLWNGNLDRIAICEKISALIVGTLISWCRVKY